MATTELVVRDRPLQVEMKPSRLLSLPKELRLQIWQYTVMDPSMESLVLRIRQGLAPCSQVEQPASKRICNPLLQQPRFHSVVETVFERPPKNSISVAILRSSKAIYHEALPILYDSILFSPCSMFHEFLVPLSDFAKQHIRAVRLSPDYYLATASHFDWAVLCAQVASLPCLQRVDIKSEHVHIWQSGRITKRLMRPLLKIKVPKTLVPARDSGAFQKTLVDIKEEMDIERAARRERREAQAAEEAQRKQGDIQEGPADIESKGVDQPPRIPEALRVAIANNLHAQDDAENDADDWDVVSVHNLAAGEENEQPITTGSKRPRSNSEDGHSPLLGYNDWELIEPDQSSDDSCNGRALNTSTTNKILAHIRENRRVYIGNLPKPLDGHTSNLELRDLFCDFRVEAVSRVLCLSEEVHGSKYYTFVDLCTAKDAANAIEELDGIKMWGTELAINMASRRPKKALKALSRQNQELFSA